jgi:hypothetical protein
MKVDVHALREMLQALAVKTGKSLDHTGLNEISEMIDGLGTNYLYKKIDQQIKNRADQEMIGVGPFQVNRILNFLGFNSLDAFQEHIANPISDQLMSLIGNYYSYVRANHTEGIVLRSPVRIYKGESNLIFELRGKDQVYKGDITLSEGCLFILMKSGQGKYFHHVYKVGVRKNPLVLQGVFSGVSTAFDPIGGRTVLIRQSLSFEDLNNRKEKAEEMISSSQVEENRVGKYFKDYCNNNLSPFKSSDFGYDDLG